MTEAEREQLMRGVEADDPTALYAYAKELSETAPDEADKFFELSAQLGNPQAAQYMGEKYLEAGNRDNAARCFKVGAKAGILDCSVRLAEIELDTDEQAAVRELEDLAEVGVGSACSALANYYKSRGKRKQYAYWRSRIK